MKQRQVIQKDMRICLVMMKKKQSVFTNLSKTIIKKTEVAYNLANILNRNYAPHANRDQLVSKLPTYLLESIQYVTESLSPSTNAATGEK